MRANPLGWLVVVLVAGIAELGVRLFDLHDSVAAPSAALIALVADLGSGELSGEIGTTLESYAGGLALAIGVGVALGVAIGSSPILRDASAVLIEFLRPIPAVAMIPLAPLDRDGALLRVAAEPLPVPGVQPAHEPAELALVDDAFELERRRVPARPDPRRLAPARVVVVERGRDRPLVVALLPRRQLRDPGTGVARPS